MPAQISITGIQRVLQMLLAERISIRDLRPSSKASPTRRHHAQPGLVAEHVRARLSRQICAQ